MWKLQGRQSRCTNHGHSQYRPGETNDLENLRQRSSTVVFNHSSVTQSSSASSATSLTEFPGPALRKEKDKPRNKEPSGLEIYIIRPSSSRAFLCYRLWHHSMAKFARFQSFIRVLRVRIRMLV